MKEHVRDAAISAGLGVLVAYLVTIDSTHPGPKWSIVRYGALLGFFAYVFCAGLTYLLRKWLDRLPLPGWLSRAALYFLGGSAAFLLTNYFVSAMGWVRFRTTFDALRAYVPVAGAIGVLAGLLFYAFGLLQQRLLKSVERLKEAEFAEKEIELARSIQQRILPPPEISADGYRIVARNLPARFVAGDFYDVFNLPDGGVGVVVADVAGKGLGASLIMATVKASLPFLAAGRSVEETLREASRRLAPRLGKREFVALVLARYDPETGAFTLANAGLPDPYLVRADGTVSAVVVPGARYPLGVRGDVAYEAASGALGKGDRLLLVSDGLPEAPVVGAAGEPLGYERFERLVAGAASLDGLIAAVKAATEPTLADDWTALMLERRP
ncbi:MAG TPA: PP2C family protein-serine/threonine phosphatase [Thermoanaerobaculia bacterium]|nr:PP2C family protein-serine/threonine phosphatase [Thermoanaerobaculia bacterium]